jgi:hypothetical protein
MLLGSCAQQDGGQAQKAISGATRVGHRTVTKERRCAGTRLGPADNLSGNMLIVQCLLTRSAMNCRPLRETFGLSASPHAAPALT